MGQVKFVQTNGDEHLVEVGAGVSVMLAAVRNGISGIDGECGGCLDCATCHVYVDEAQAALLPPPQQDEIELLASVSGERRRNSRLGCQLTLPAAIETLVVHVPEVR